MSGPLIPQLQTIFMYNPEIGRRTSAHTVISTTDSTKVSFLEAKSPLTLHRYMVEIEMK
jgi:hypothetical protein